MALIDFDISPAEQTLDIIRSGARGCLQQIKASVENSKSVVWQNPFGLSPQEVFDALDTQGKVLVDLLATLRTAHNSVVPAAHHIGALLPDGMTVTFNAEGKGTVGEV